ncbi:MAG TPA: SH3 domain-containing protein [Xanthobacteraceae bacterium]|nr:SH3 domain-containing protein [Xanthobacteraceae bacterium]
MRTLSLAGSALILVLAAATLSAQQASAPQPYKAVAVKPPTLLNDPTLDAFRKDVAAAAQRKDRAALARMVVAKGFFWERMDGKGADDKKSGIDNLAAALNLDAKDGSGWEALAAAVGEGKASPDPQNKGVACAPALPDVDDKAFDALIRDTNSDPSEWGVPNAPGVEVRAAPKADAPVVEKLGLVLIRGVVDDSPLNAVEGTNTEWLRVVTPSGKTGYVALAEVSAVVGDQICYLKDASGWKIIGIVGGAGDQP